MDRSGANRLSVMESKSERKSQSSLVNFSIWLMMEKTIGRHVKADKIHVKGMLKKGMNVHGIDKKELASHQMVG